MIFERKTLRRIFGPELNEEGEYETRSNRELNGLFNEPSIVAILKSQGISWAGHVWKAEDQLIRTIAEWKPKKSRPRGRPVQRWEDRVEDDLRMLGVTDEEETAEDRNVRTEITEAAMDLNGLE